MTLTQRVAANATNELLQEIIERLTDLPNGLRTSIADHQWSTIPLYVDEWAAADAQAANTPLLVGPQTSGLELITSVVACVPAGATAVIQLGMQKLYVPSGVTPLTSVQKIMQTTDTRSITATAAGPLALWLTGQQLPTTGVLAK